MKKTEMFEKVMKLLELVDVLIDYGLFDYEDKAEIEYRTFEKLIKIAEEN